VPKVMLGGEVFTESQKSPRACRRSEWENWMEKSSPAGYMTVYPRSSPLATMAYTVLEIPVGLAPHKSRNRRNLRNLRWGQLQAGNIQKDNESM